MYGTIISLWQSFPFAQAFSTRQILNYNDHPKGTRPRPQPISVIDMDFTGEEITNMTRFVTLALPIGMGDFNSFLEDHIASGIAPITSTYHGSQTPWMRTLTILDPNGCDPVMEDRGQSNSVLYLLCFKIRIISLQDALFIFINGSGPGCFFIFDFM
jgi:hypothetical protein